MDIGVLDCECEIIKRRGHDLPGSWRLGSRTPGPRSCFSPEWDFCTQTHRKETKEATVRRQTESARVASNQIKNALTNLKRFPTQKHPQTVNSCWNNTHTRVENMCHVWRAGVCVRDYPRWLGGNICLHTLTSCFPVSRLTQLPTNKRKHTLAHDASRDGGL